MERVPLTREGKERLQAELKHMKNVQRPEIVTAIEEARAHGDLKENAEYHAAKEAQGKLEARILMFSDQLSRAQVIDPSSLDNDRVVFGLVVRVFDENDEQEKEYQIVGDLESDIEKGRLSVLSPIAKALIGKEEGDAVTVKTPGGTRNLEIIEIKHP
ncbi:MAG: transcription elongation factor GreA [Deltaproteobacteria bacterium]|nr:transcription elongation factor GreA [Deltaproteobacteria bacterium]